jgi:hypothetical protein
VDLLWRGVGRRVFVACVGGARWVAALRVPKGARAGVPARLHSTVWPAVVVRGTRCPDEMELSRS